MQRFTLIISKNMILCLLQNDVVCSILILLSVYTFIILNTKYVIKKFNYLEIKLEWIFCICDEYDSEEFILFFGMR